MVPRKSAQTLNAAINAGDVSTRTGNSRRYCNYSYRSLIRERRPITIYCDVWLRANAIKRAFMYAVLYVHQILSAIAAKIYIHVYIPTHQGFQLLIVGRLDNGHEIS